MKTPFLNRMLAQGYTIQIEGIGSTGKVTGSKDGIEVFSTTGSDYGLMEAIEEVEDLVSWQGMDLVTKANNEFIESRKTNNDGNNGVDKLSAGQNSQ